MLIDDIKIKVSSGKGGNGIVAFSKIKMTLGPTGGDGGNGGAVYLEGISNIGALSQFRGKKSFYAENGKDGKGQKKNGKNGKDLVLKVPVGTVVHLVEKGIIKEILKIGEKILICEGGRGGRGNFVFRSSSNTTPRECEKGQAGEKITLHLELKLIADIGLIGLPNVGKSSLLNALTNAKSRTANYSFTTLDPNLGVFNELVLADIPGLIEGASFGKGLGIKFLKHIERTTSFFHLISAQSQNPLEDYKIVRQELEKYNKKLLEKKEYVFVSQSDLAQSEKIMEIKKIFKLAGIEVLEISIKEKETIDNVRKILNKIIKEKTFSE